MKTNCLATDMTIQLGNTHRPRLICLSDPKQSVVYIFFLVEQHSLLNLAKYTIIQFSVDITDASISKSCT